MPIICLEGPSAVGKTTTAEALAARGDAAVVPEVNQLFTRPADEPAEWYFERQVERWSMARERAARGRLVVLDGDPFQPLWYNWAYRFEGWQDLDFMERFYRPRVRAGRILFPDLYFIFNATEAELRRRKEADAGRRRRGFETHLRMIEPQRRYFGAMRSFSPRRVLFLEAETVEANVEFVRRSSAAAVGHDADESAELFDRMIAWLRADEA